jgi:hypothetical protein
VAVVAAEPAARLDANDANDEALDAAADETNGHDDGGGAAPGAFDPTRRLCDDGSCVGVVGADGVCRVCGRRVEG